MAYNYEYPHFEAPQYNMDWILETIKRLEEEVLGLDNYNYEGENKVLDLNELNPNSMASFTENFNVLNAPLSGVRRFVFTNGSETGGFQRCYDLKNMETYERTFSITSGITVYSEWKKTQNAPGLNIHNMNRFEKGSVNDLPINTVVLVYNTSAVTDGATTNSAHVMTFKSPNDGSIIQVWFDLGNFFIYLRSCSDGRWTAWVEANHIDLTAYTKQINVTGSAFNIPNNRLTISYTPSETNAINGSFFNMYNSAIFGIGDANAGVNRGRLVTLIRNNIFDKHMVNAPSYDFGDIHAMPEQSSFFIHPTTINNPTGNNYGYAFRYTSSTSQDGVCLVIGWNGEIYTSIVNNGNFGSWNTFSKNAVFNAKIISSAQTDVLINGKKEPVENIFTYVQMKKDFTSLPGQSLLHSDEGKQSFKAAIMESDISNTDVIITNFELWDMDLPLTEISTAVLDLIVWMRDQNPMCDLTLMSIPPVDIPLWGDEFLDYEMQNGSTVRQLDEEMLKLSEEHGFTYLPFNDFYASQNRNLREYLGRNMKTNKQYIRRVASFLKNRIM